MESPVINNQNQEEQIINSPSNNIIVSSNYQIQSQNINTNTDINNNFSEQYIQSQNISNNDNINQNYDNIFNLKIYLIMIILIKIMNQQQMT